MTAVKFILHHCSDHTDVNTEDPNGWTPLFYATEEIHLDVAELLLSHPQIDVNKGDKYGDTVLHLNSDYGNKYVVELLLQHPQIDVNKGNNDGWTALHAASAKGEAEILSLLLQHPKVDVNKKYRYGSTSLSMMINDFEVDREVINLFLIHFDIDVFKGLNMSEGEEYNETGRIIFGNELIGKNEKFLIDAMMGNFFEVNKQLEVNKTLINFEDKLGMTALLWASKEGYPEIVELLINNSRVDINKERNIDGATALMLASYNGHTNVVDILLDQYDIGIAKITTLTGESALMLASYKGHEDIVRLLVAKNILNINDVSSNGESSLYKASQNGHIEVVRLLLDTKDIDINGATVERVTPLMASAKEGHEDIVKILLADPHLEADFADYDGKTALFYSIPTYYHVDHKKLQNVVELLLRCPSIDANHLDENHKNALYYATISGFTNLTLSFENRFILMRDGHTCCSDQVNDGLQIAAEEGNLKMVQSFLRCSRVDLNIGYKYDITPLYLASNNNYPDLVEELLNDPRTNVNVEVNSATALYTAAKYGNTDVVRLLLSHNDIDVNKVNRQNKMSAFMASVEKGLIDIFRLLLSHAQTDVNIIDAKDESALSIAAKKGSIILVKLLIRCSKVRVSNIQHLLLKGDGYLGLNIQEVLMYHFELKDLPTCCLNADESLLKAAWIGDFRGIRGLLVCPNANINAVDMKGRTPLYLASWLNHRKVVEELLLVKDKEIDVNSGKLTDGNTPFSIASEKGHGEVLEKLIEHGEIRPGRGWNMDSWTTHITILEIAVEPTTPQSTTETAIIG